MEGRKGEGFTRRKEEEERKRRIEKELRDKGTLPRFIKRCGERERETL